MSCVWAAGVSCRRIFAFLCNRRHPVSPRPVRSGRFLKMDRSGEAIMDHDIALTRRDVVKASAATAVALAAADATRGAALAQAATTVSGVVFEDRSGTGRRQPSDPGL